MLSVLFPCWVELIRLDRDRMIRNFNIVVFFLVVFLLQSCASSGVAPVDNRGEVKEPIPKTTQRDTKTYKSTSKQSAKPVIKDNKGYHIVTKGDTLYSIAWRYNQDYKDVAAWNRINSPYTIYPGQLIRLKPPPRSLPERTKSPVSSSTQPLTKKGESLQIETIDEKTKVATTKPAAKPLKKETESVVKKSSIKPNLPTGPVKWSWPTPGSLDKSNSPTSQKGIDITGKAGQTVKAAAYGEVVYSGSGLLGYGKLIIIKHNETYLSAYAYNSKLLVKEGDRVNAGQVISYMGKDHTGRSVLHFEIRKNGKPVNPVKYLPKKSA